MIVYEVNIRVEREQSLNYAEWLRLHVDEMLRLNVFDSAEIFVRTLRDEGEDEDPDYSHFTVHYRVRDREQLDRYFKDFAPTMRQKVKEVFGDHIRIHRRILSRIRSDEMRSIDVAAINS